MTKRGITAIRNSNSEQNSKDEQSSPVLKDLPITLLANNNYDTDMFGLKL